MSELSPNPVAPLRLGAIAFINTLPIYSTVAPEPGLDIVYAPPSGLNQLVDDGLLDVSPVSSAFYLRHHQELDLLADLSVSSFGSVESVLFLSRRPLGPELLAQDVIAVPDSSETSIALLAHLLEEATGVDCQDRFRTYPAAHYRSVLDETGAMLVIGDDALRLVDEGVPTGYHCYDLASLWVERTGLPFVFAVWVVRKAWLTEDPANAQRLDALNRRLSACRDRFFADETLLEDGVRIARTRCTISPETLRGYFTRSLDYRLGEAHRQALTQFHGILNHLDANRDPETPGYPALPSCSGDAALPLGAV
jgi:chorismate dehydratase